ncbi:MAG: substrate-binding domain-containing protein [Anaerolineae bacterium]|nr:substrate-binding domain-containing protein [Anaerolineae bacterium]
MPSAPENETTDSPGDLCTCPHRARPTIGYLAPRIGNNVSEAFWRGVVNAAQRLDANLICFAGDQLRDATGFSSPANAVYDLASPQIVDGLVSWASSVGGTLEDEEVERFHHRYHPLPIISITLPMAGCPTVSIDSYAGMRALVIHMIEVHGCRRLAFVRGPENHYYAQERYQAYRDVLQERGIPFDAALVTRPVDWKAGAEAAQILLDERGLRPRIDFDAVVAASDRLAYGALQTLQARGIRVPDDMAAVGFNDSRESQLTRPPLTSVALPFYEQGERAVEVLLAKLAGENVPALTTLQSKLMIRQSCGCPSPSVALAQERPKSYRELAAKRDEILTESLQAFEASGDIASQVDGLLTAFYAEMAGDAHDLFVPALKNILQKAMAAESDIAAWHTVVATVRGKVLPYLDTPRQLQAEALFEQAHVLIGEAVQRAQAHEEWQAEKHADSLRHISQALITTFDMDKLVDMLAEQLPQIGIDSCYLALYEHAESPLDRARMILAYTERGRVKLEPNGTQFPSSKLAPEGLLPRHRRHSLVVEPLYFEREQIGFAIFEVGPQDGTVYEVLRGAISSALKGALLLQSASEAQAAAEKADRIKTRLLANVSHEMRTPLNIILGYTKEALDSPGAYGAALPATLLNDLEHIQHSAEHQLRVINDLLDLSRAEIDALDLYLELFDPRPLLEDGFHSMADRAAAAGDISWHLQLPERLPLIQADPVRLRQILLNLLSNAIKFTEQGHITLGARVSPPHLHIWVEDTGTGIPPHQQERIFEPFVTAELGHRRLDGVGLGLSITRRLVALHGGSMTLDSQPGRGSTFHVHLPLPSLGESMPQFHEPAQPVLLLISASEHPVAEIAEFSERQGLEMHHLRADDDLDAMLAGVQSAVVAWDLTSAHPGDWAIVRRLHNHPRLSQSPFILYDGNLNTGDRALSVGLTGFTVKPARAQTLLDMINTAAPSSTGSILIVDDDAEARELCLDVVTRGLPGCPVRTANDGTTALAIMSKEIPSLVILDLMMPGMDGFELLDRMRADPRTRQVPVVILSGRLLNLEDVKRLEKHALVTLQSKGVLSETEIVATLHRALFDDDALPPLTSALVKRAVAYLHQNYTRPLARWEIANAIGASEDYLSRVFHRELGLSPWDYLNRYRVEQAKQLLRRTNNAIGAIASQVGFKDPLYFSRVFRKMTGLSPSAFRKSS